MSLPLAASTTPLLGEILVARALVREADIERALDLQKAVGGRLGTLLVRTGALSEEPLLEVLAEQLGLPLAGRDIALPGVLDWQPVEADGLTAEWMLQREVFIWQVEDSVCCAARDPLDPALVESLNYLLPGRDILMVLAATQLLARALEQVSGALAGAGGDDVRQLRELAEEAPVVELVSGLMAQAVEQRASDIHLEPGEHQFDVRFRIDGILYARLQLPRARFNAVASRLKLITGMDIAERRLPQDGRMSTRAGGQAMDIRASALPGVHGESIVLRLLPKERGDLALGGLGMEADHLEMLGAWSREAHGIVLVTGPTGSGKSTTLYATLAACNDGRKKIITVEDPVEFQLPGITQIQTHADIGLNFASVLRSVLRQDPDVIMVGEIRDRETAEIAIQAALTGHLVLSTVHTNDALGAFTRLVDMGVEPFLVATPVKGLQAQRLVRRLCVHCARPSASILGSVHDEVERLAATLPGMGQARWMEAVGCAQCQHTGYRGRVGIYEVIPVDEDLRQAVVDGAGHPQLLRMAKARGVRMLREDGLLKAWQGVTSVEEVLRVTAG